MIRNVCVLVEFENGFSELSSIMGVCLFSVIVVIVIVCLSCGNCLMCVEVVNGMILWVRF